MYQQYNDNEEQMWIFNLESLFFVICTKSFTQSYVLELIICRPVTFLNFVIAELDKEKSAPHKPHKTPTLYPGQCAGVEV